MNFLKLSISISNTEIPSSSAPDSSSSHSSNLIPENGVGVWKTWKLTELELTKGAVTPTVFVRVTLISWLVRLIVQVKYCL